MCGRLRCVESPFGDRDLIESKNHGIFHLLDEESKLPKPEFGHFTHAVHKQFNNNSRIQLPRASRLKAHRTLRDDEGFLLRHFAGAVCYNTCQFIEKNNDALHASLEFLVQESGSTLVQQLFATTDNNNAKGKLNFISVGAKFQAQLAQLMDKLKENGTNFVRCIKPNSRMVGREIDGALVLTQLQCSGTISVLELMEHGYPCRAPFQDLHDMYKSYLPPKLQKLSPKLFCQRNYISIGTDGARLPLPRALPGSPRHVQVLPAAQAAETLAQTLLSGLYPYSGTSISVLELMEHGYPCRAPFQDLHDMYKSYLPPKLQKLSPKLFCQRNYLSIGTDGARLSLPRALPGSTRHVQVLPAAQTAETLAETVLSGLYPYSGTISVLELMEHGYPCRAPFQDLHDMYKSYLPPKL
ncbi:myosin head (motor domain) domain-containing protein [Phthorimaea operculella]|nr:myosin head (motor domain) domain-containing protein [Phthorimaea operculella]